MPKYRDFKKLLKTIIYAIVISIIILSSFLYAEAKTKMSASINGWYEAMPRDNTNLDITTNMQVWINGQKVIRK